MFYTIFIFSANRHFVFIPLLNFLLSYTLPYVSAKTRVRMTFFSGLLGEEGVTCYETLQQLFDKVQCRFLRRNKIQHLQLWK